MGQNCPTYRIVRMDILVLPNVGRRDLKRFFFALGGHRLWMATAKVKKMQVKRWVEDGYKRIRDNYEVLT